MRGLLRDYLGDDPLNGDFEARYEWIYRNNPHGHAITFVAHDGGLPVGMASLFPRRVATPSGEWLGAIGGDSFVQPSHRRRGIARQLHRHTFTYMQGRHSAIALMFAAPRPFALAAVHRAGGETVGQIRRFVRPQRWLRPLRALRWLRLRSRARASLITSTLGLAADPRVDSIWETVSAELLRRGGVVPVRDAAYTAWRYGAAPARLQTALVIESGTQPVGLAAIERSADRLAIIDLFAPMRDVRACLRAVIEQASDDESIEAIEFRMHEGCAIRSTLYSLGFVPRESQPFLVQCPNRHTPLQSPHAWWFTVGDLDVDRTLQHTARPRR